jgi:carboxypeptidase C (cathepsin A)
MLQEFLLVLTVVFLLLSIVLGRALVLSIRQTQRIRNLWINSSDQTALILQNLSTAIECEINNFDGEMRNLSATRDSIMAELMTAKNDWNKQKDHFQLKLFQSGLEPLNKEDIIKGYHKL